jgi:glycosyltransferase involved in cell wall biosynthesis|tara:strand:+ start:221 stop:1444 length:1224 start_codon:yes stop_codon:yes gene_type:complete
MARKKKKSLPFVSVCTPTFNRRPFISSMIKCFLNQTYPHDRMEWIIIDDGTDSIEDIIKYENVPQIKYYRYEEKISLGKKRNLMHEKSTGEIIVYMDDDDYYPPDRVKHAVEKLKGDSKALCAGSSIIHVYFKHIKKIIEFGPYGETHATAGTFAFKRELLDQTSYENHAALAEEKHFLKNYTIPFVQLDPKKTILVFSHLHNTFDKKKLLEQGYNNVMKECNLNVKDFIEDGETRDFYMNKIDSLLKNYGPGDPSNKPEVEQQMKELEKQREEMMKKRIMETPSIITIVDENNQTRPLKNGELIELLQEKDTLIKDLQSRLNSNETSITVHNEKNEIKKLNNEDIVGILNEYRKNLNEIQNEKDKIEKEKEQIEKDKNKLTMENNLLKQKINILEKASENVINLCN